MGESQVMDKIAEVGTELEIINRSTVEGSAGTCSSGNVGIIVLHKKIVSTPEAKSVLQGAGI
jgi:hypothetical protein